MTGRAPYITRKELTALDAYAKGATISDIAGQLNRCENYVRRKLRFLHITPPVASTKYIKPVPDDSPLRCQVCGIMLSAAAEMDGAGDDKMCKHCICLKAGVNLYEHHDLPGAPDPIVHLCEAWGMAAGR